MSKARAGRAYCLRLSDTDADRLDAVQAHYQGRIDALGQAPKVTTADVFRTLLRAEAERLGVGGRTPARAARARRAKQSAA
jgi:hypothetical protein